MYPCLIEVYDIEAKFPLQVMVKFHITNFFKLGTAHQICLLFDIFIEVVSLLFSKFLTDFGYSKATYLKY